MENKDVLERIRQNQIDQIYKEGIYSDLMNNRMSLAEHQDCPLCIKRDDGNVGTMRKMHGKYGTFLSCNRYPVCKFSWNTPDLDADMQLSLEPDKVIVWATYSKTKTPDQTSVVVTPRLAIISNVDKIYISYLQNLFHEYM